MYSFPGFRLLDGKTLYHTLFERVDIANHRFTRCNPRGIKIDILAKRYVICHLKTWALLIIVA